MAYLTSEAVFFTPSLLKMLRACDFTVYRDKTYSWAPAWSPDGQWIAFVVFGLIALAGALGMATTMSMFRSGIFLMASFMGVAGLFILLLADLLGFLQEREQEQEQQEALLFLLLQLVMEKRYR